GATGETAADQEIRARVPSGLPCVRVFNKIDLTGQRPAIEQREDGTQVWLSTRTGAGVDGLRKVLLQLAGWEGRGEDVLIARARHIKALETARMHLAEATGVEGQLELFAEELRSAQTALGGITGEYTSDQLLGEIFSRFCIGK